MKSDFPFADGKNGGCGILDAHVHLPWKTGDGRFPGFREAAAYAKQTGVTGMIFNCPNLSWSAGATVGQLDESNRRVLAISEADPHFFHPAAVIHPALPEASSAWLKIFRERRFPWVGELLSFSGAEFDSPEWMRLFAVCCEHGHIVQLHGTPDVLRLARAMPDLKIVQSHLTTRFWPPMNEELARIAECPNVMLDISGFGGLRLGGLEFALKHFGPDRILFGTDFTVYGPELFVTRVRQTFPDPEVREKIFRRNLLALLASSGCGGKG